MNAGNLKFAVIGCGHIGRRHISMIQSNPECDLVALCDTSPFDTLNLNIPDVPFFSSLEGLLDSGIEMDIVCIATPNGLHEEHAIKSLKKGYHIVVEKPMALTKTGCERIIYEALHHHRHVFCVMQNRYSPSSSWLKQIITDKILGNLFIVHVNCFWNRSGDYYRKDNWHGTQNLDGGTLFTQFSHFIDIMFWLFGDIENIQTRFKNFNHHNLIEFEDSGIVSFDFVNGGIGCINYSTSVWNTNFETSITIVAENGSVKVGGQYMNEVIHCDIKDYEMPVLAAGNPANNYGLYKGSAANHNFVFDNVVDVLKGRAPITTNALEGLKVVEIIEKIYSFKK